MKMIPVLALAMLATPALAAPKKAAAKASAKAAAPTKPVVVQPAANPAFDTNYFNRQQSYLWLLKAEDGWNTTATGLRWRRVKGDGTGAHPLPTDTVTLHYTGTLVDGTKFDSSVDRNEPATFPLPRLIKGWQEAVPLMGIGDTFEVAIPMELAYGPTGRGPIPPGATLLFTI